MDYPKKLTPLSFCSGLCGIERGIELTGIELKPVAYVEIEAYPIENLVVKMEAGSMVPAPIWTDIKTFPAKEFSGMVDLITGGFPCQPFSSAGRKKADSDPRHLFPYIKRHIEVIKPKYVFLENVDGIASAKLKGEGWTDPEGTPVLLHACRELERMGYQVETKCYTAREMGAPHKRQRWFILGYSESNNKRRKSQPPMYGEGERVRRSGGELGNTTSKGSQDRRSSSVCNHQKKQEFKRSSSFYWPMPPGPNQWEWEAPRTVANDNSKRKLQQGGSKQNIWKWTSYRNKRETKPGLGGAASGIPKKLVANRIDRLRALGNSVVPQTAARAWIDLWVDLHFPTRVPKPVQMELF